jgi:hypothetical protein
MGLSLRFMHFLVFRAWSIPTESFLESELGGPNVPDMKNYEVRLLTNPPSEVTVCGCEGRKSGKNSEDRSIEGEAFSRGEEEETCGRGKETGTRGSDGWYENIKAGGGDIMRV